MENLFSLTAFKQIIRLFTHDEKGVVAVIYAVLLMPILALSGATLDYSQASSIKNKLQTSADNAALAAGRALEVSDDENYITNIATSVFFENMNNSGVVGEASIEVILIEDGVRIEVASEMKTSFLQLVGKQSLNISAKSEIGVSASQVEVVLVLDTTLSMEGEKLEALKHSARMLTYTLMKKEENGSVKIGLVPFSRYVNIGMDNRNEPGIEVPADYSQNRADYCRNTYPNSTRRCDRRRETFSCTRDGMPSTCSKWVYYNCTGERGEPVQICTPRSPKRFKWYGCVGSRDYPLNTLDERYAANPVPGILNSWNSCKVKPLTRLTDHRDSVISGIDVMTPKDNTYIPAGLAWGWRLLSSKLPFGDGADYDSGIKKVLVLMTDGANTVSPRYPFHTRRNVNVANDLTEKLCENIKDDNVVVYTIAFDVSNNAIENILENCAGNGGSYFDAADADELEDAFENIAKDLTDLRLTK